MSMKKFRRKNASFVFLNYRNISIEDVENIKNVFSVHDGIVKSDLKKRSSDFALKKLFI